MQSQRWPFALLMSTAVAVACSSTSSTNDGPTGTVNADASTGVDPTGESTQSVEWVSFHTEVPFAASAFDPLISGLFGADAQAGKFITKQEVAPDVYLTSTAETTTPQQSRVALTFNDGSATPRTLALVPASFDVGNTFLKTIDSAMATMQSEEQQSAGSSAAFLLQYQVTSPMGGTFSFGVHGVTGTYTLVLDVSSPTTSLTVGKIGTPAAATAPYDLIAGTVWFGLTQDDFDYFVNQAYGTGATAGQNFEDFALVPFTWLRLSVTPHLSQKYVNVAFQILNTDGSRTPIASAPASILAGKTFQTLVDRNMSNMTAQEAKKAGSSTPWTAPFYYNDPSGGGVVQVVAQGALGAFNVAYAVLSPRHTLSDVPFNAYPNVDIEAPDGSVVASCNKLGNPDIRLASAGSFDITFTVSSVVTNSSTLKVPLVGDIYCSTYKASDVTVSGPNPNAVALQNFTVENASFQPGAPAPHYLTGSLPDGEYQILCGQDILHNGGNIGMGDPVTLPIGGFTIACNLNPVTVQFALLDPEP